LLLPELERPNNKLSYFVDKHSVTVYKENALATTIGQLKEHVFLDNTHNIGTVNEKEVLLNNRVVVDHLSASWTLVIINYFINYNHVMAP